MIKLTIRNRGNSINSKKRKTEGVGMISFSRYACIDCHAYSYSVKPSQLGKEHNRE